MSLNGSVSATATRRARRSRSRFRLSRFRHRQSRDPRNGLRKRAEVEKTDEAEARLENLQELVNAAVDYDEQGIEGLREFIDHSALVSDTDQYKQTRR